MRRCEKTFVKPVGLAVVVGALILVGPGWTGQRTTGDDDSPPLTRFAQQEDVSPPRFGWSETEVLSAFGEPDMRNPSTSGEAVGLYRQSWVYREIGLTVRMEAEAETGPYALVAMRFVDDLGPLHLRMSETEVLEAIGEPDSRSDGEVWGATGFFVQTWFYPTLGIALEMETRIEDEPARVIMMTADEHCKLLTSRGIHVGSGEEEVIAQYGAYQEPDSSASSDSFVAGSIYGGVIFRFTEGLVTGLFFGAAAE